MHIDLTAQTIITAGAFVGALTGLVAVFVRAVRWMDRQKAQDNELQQLKATHAQDNAAAQQELGLLTYGILACLKGLKEQGCNGPVTEAISKIENHLNKKAHE